MLRRDGSVLACFSNMSKTVACCVFHTSSPHKTSLFLIYIYRQHNFTSMSKRLRLTFCSGSVKVQVTTSQTA